MPLIQNVRRKRDLAGLAKEQGFRLTSQRKLIYSILESASTHLNVKEILAQAREVDPGIDQVTIYRNLAVLKKLGIVDELDLLHLRGDQHYYEARQDRAHSHVACLQCGKVMEFSSPALEKITSEIKDELGFNISFMRVEVGGICAECRRKSAKKSTASRAARN
jgi:Fur family ferric uptake transcriptional regulator